jgi:hypothetical protein
MTEYDPAADGWRTLPAAALPAGLGVPWAKRSGDKWIYGLLTVAAHANLNGVVHGGVLMAFADQGLGLLAWEAAERLPCTTIQLNTHFMGAIKPGEFIEIRGEITQRTRGHIFLRGVVSTRTPQTSQDVGAIDGIWRVLRLR